MKTVQNPVDPSQTYTYGTRGRKPAWVKALEVGEIPEADETGNKILVHPADPTITYTYGKSRGRKPAWVAEMESTPVVAPSPPPVVNLIGRFNKLARNCVAPYDIPMDKDGPKIVEVTEAGIKMFDGWTEVEFDGGSQEVNALRAGNLLENLRSRAMCIQRRLKQKRILDYNSFIDLFGKGAIDTAQNDEDGVTDAEERQAGRTNLVI